MGGAGNGTLAQVALCFGQSMCGIVGIFDLEAERPVDTSRLAPALAVMRSRGPDAEGLWSVPGCAFGHRRLSILDLEGGQQPWTDPGQAPGALTYNGELYNFCELRERYAHGGYTFRSQCDTEVVFAAWVREGPAALEHFNGIFAFAASDGRDRLWLVRDPLGVKPLYYSVIDGMLYFASTMAALPSRRVWTVITPPPAGSPALRPRSLGHAAPE